MVTQLNTSLLLSYNLAYGGATVDSALVPPIFWTVHSMRDQVSEFSENLAAKPSYAPWTTENTLVGVWMGVNDVGNSYPRQDAFSIYRKVMATYFELLQVLYDAGVRKFALLLVPRKPSASSREYGILISRLQPRTGRR